MPRVSLNPAVRRGSIVSEGVRLHATFFGGLVTMPAVRPSIAALAGCVFVVLGRIPVRPAAGTALDDYVAEPDGTYRWSQVRTLSG